jgi:hypothetical protein
MREQTWSNPENTTNNRAEALHRDQSRVQNARQPLALAIGEDITYYKWAEMEHEAASAGEKTGAGTRRRKKSTRNAAKKLTAKRARVQHEKTQPEWDDETGGKIVDSNWRADEVAAAESEIEGLVVGEYVYTPFKNGTFYLYRVVRPRGNGMYDLLWLEPVVGKQKDLYRETKEIEDEHVDALVCLETGLEMSGHMEYVGDRKFKLIRKTKKAEKRPRRSQHKRKKH